MSKSPAAAKRGIPSKENFKEWYPFIVEAAELVDKKISNQRNGCVETLWLENHETYR